MCRLSVVCLSVYGDRPRGTPPPSELNERGVAKYSDFGPIDGYISETVYCVKVHVRYLIS